jgi:prepilin-type N-terminal cleavage/methylation domain-containing protein
MTKLNKLQKKKGFTLVELLVAVSILAIVTMALLPRLLPYSEAARTSAANKELRNLNTIVEAFAAVDGDYPEASLDLENPRSIASVMQDHGVKWTDDETGETDPWGNPYYYQSLGGGLYCIISAGPDGVLGTDDDLYIDNFSNLSKGIPPIDMNEIIVPSSSNNANPGSDDPGEEHQAEVPPGYTGIYTPAELASIGVQEGFPLDGDYIVMANISLSGYVDWAPIGDEASPFTGTFDGNNYIISNLTIGDSSSYKGLFGYTSEEAEIVDVGLQNVDITNAYQYIGSLVGWNNGTITNCYATGNITGNYYTGGLVGYNNGTITNSYATGSVTGYNEYTGGLVGSNFEGTLTNCYATGEVTGNKSTGGLVGYNTGAIENCYTTGKVSGSGDYIGGLVGLNLTRGTLTNCYATGNITGYWYTGGLVGQNYGTITDCYATGSVEGDYYTGGLVGDNRSIIKNCYATGKVTGNNRTGGLVGRNDETLTNCYATGEVTGDSETGGLVGYNKKGSITNCYATGEVTGYSSTGGLVGRNDDTITNSYYNSETTGQSDTGKGEPLTTAQMKDQSNFVDWDFILTWDTDNSYPFLIDNEQIPHPGI